MTAGFMVIGESGPMALSKRNPGLWFGVRRGTEATWFPTRSAALRALAATLRRVPFPDELEMRVVRLVPEAKP